MRPSPIITVLMAKWWPQAHGPWAAPCVVGRGRDGPGRARQAQSWLPPALWGSPGPPATVMAEMSMFLFTSLPLERKHLRECILMLKKERLRGSLCVPESLFRSRQGVRAPLSCRGRPFGLPCVLTPSTCTGSGRCRAHHRRGLRGASRDCAPCATQGPPEDRGTQAFLSSLPCNPAPDWILMSCPLLF